MEFIVNPISKIIGYIFTQLLYLFRNEGVALVALSFIVNLLLLPFYTLAEKIEKREKELQKSMKPKIDEFKKVYKGYEKYLYINNVYRLNNYHPVYSLRGLLSLLIQVPFFLGAYVYLSSFSGFEGVSFTIISDLSRPDGLLSIGKYCINLLPIIMIVINLWSGYVFSKDGTRNEQITLVLIALFFLIILYNSPASLLLYWTFNNIFSCICYSNSGPIFD